MNCPLSALFTVMSLSIEQYIDLSCVSIALTMHDVSLCAYTSPRLCFSAILSPVATILTSF